MDLDSNESSEVKLLESVESRKNKEFQQNMDFISMDNKSGNRLETEMKTFGDKK
jgi:hypothetical protein